MNCMELPLFPEFKEIGLNFRDVIQEHLRSNPLEASEYTFTNLFAFRDLYNFKIASLKHNLIILKNAEPRSMFCPVGNSHMDTVLDELSGYLIDERDTCFMERVPESFVNSYLTNNDRYRAGEERAHFDYVYDIKELAELKGRKFHDKKNKVNKFRNSYTYEYASITPDLIAECLEFEDYWCEVRECEKYYGLHKERCAIREMLNNFGALELRGGVIRMEGKIAALTLGEKLLPDTLVIHIEKANADIPGLYQVIQQEFLIHEAGDFRFVNREQDLGMEGLRRSKMSYNPMKFVKKYTVRWAQER